MRVLVSNLLLVAYLVLMLRPSLPLVEYELRQGLIAKEFCVNSDDPDSGCQGSCYLNKRLKEAAGEQEPTSESEQEIVVPVHLFNFTSLEFNAPDQLSWQTGKLPMPKQRMTSPPVPPPELHA